MSEEPKYNDVLQRLYSSEINIELGWCWDGGIDVAIGNAYGCGLGEPEAKYTAESILDALRWLAETACELYPDSAFTKWWRDEA